ncbi:hypothetical protein ACS0TY_022812 [Phlomoides rotata]
MQYTTILLHPTHKVYPLLYLHTLSLLRVSVVGENTINGRRTKSHLRLVDLPGSERIGRNGVEKVGERER